MKTEQAFPNPHRTDMTGMTLRDYFAAKAMQSMCLTVKREQDVEIIPEAAYRMADAMLEARKQA